MNKAFLFNSLIVEWIVTLNVVMTFMPGRYPAKSSHKSYFIYQKHFYPIIGALWEEENCARIIDSHAIRILIQDAAW